MYRIIALALLALGLLAGCSDKTPAAPEKIGAPPPAASQALRPPPSR